MIMMGIRKREAGVEYAFAHANIFKGLVTHETNEYKFSFIDLVASRV